jgi:hypothetical protein
MGINDEKEKFVKIHRIEDFIFYFSFRSSVLLRGYIGELVKCKTSKIYPTTKNSYQARHIRPPSRIPETLAGL